MKRAIKPGRDAEEVVINDRSRRKSAVSVSHPPIAVNLLDRFERLLADTRRRETKNTSSTAVKDIPLRSKKTAPHTAEIVPIASRAKRVNDKLKKQLTKGGEPLTLQELLAHVDDTEDIGILRQADAFSKKLRERIQRRIKAVLGIETSATVSFNDVKSTYSTKTGETKTYHSLKASWNEAGKTKSRTLKP